MVPVSSSGSSIGAVPTCRVTTRRPVAKSLAAMPDDYDRAHYPDGTIFRKDDA